METINNAEIKIILSELKGGEGKKKNNKAFHKPVFWGNVIQQTGSE